MIKKGCILELLYPASEGEEGICNEQFSKIVDCLETIRKINRETTQRTLNGFIGIASVEELEAYYKKIIQLLGNNIHRQLFSTSISSSIKQQKILSLIVLCNECFAETAGNYFLGASDAVLVPIYQVYKEKIK